MTIEKGLEILVMGGQPLEHAALLERLKAEGQTYLRQQTMRLPSNSVKTESWILLY